MRSPRNPPARRAFGGPASWVQRARRARDWYRTNRASWSELRDDVVRGLSHLHVVVAPALFGLGTARRSLREWDDERVQIMAMSSGLVGARGWNSFLGVFAIIVLDYGNVAIAVLVWSVVNLAVAMLPLVARVRFARVSAGRFPGEDPKGQHAGWKARQYWNRALWDAERARTGLSPRRLRRRQRSGDERS